MQNLVGGYAARLDRLLISALFRNGERVLSGFVVSQRAAGVNTSVDVTAGEALIQGDDQDRQGLYLAMSTAATWTAGFENVPAPVKPGSNSRWDILVLRAIDSQALGSGTTNSVIFDWIQGTASGTPALPTLPPSCLRLVNILRAASETTGIVNSQITDAAIRAPFPFGSGDNPPTMIGRAGDVYIEW
jgi:hypothetical protein